LESLRIPTMTGSRAKSKLPPELVVFVWGV
jgi:hypothetical protein